MSSEEFVYSFYKERMRLKMWSRRRIGQFLGLGERSVEHWLYGEKLPPVNVREVILEVVKGLKNG